MFISQINRNFTFGTKCWLVSVASPIEDHQTIPAAYLFIEGVLNNKLIFGRYEIKATPWQTKDSKITESIGYLSSIQCMETNQYKNSGNIAASIGYPATPKQCDDLSKHLKQLALKIHEDTLIANVPPKKPVLIHQGCINWCFDLLWKHNI